MQDELLLKTVRINMLFDFYESLLTDKQQTFMRLYYHDNYSLGEIAEQFAISRQAVYEHIKRAERMLEDYESRLALLGKHEARVLLIERLREAVSELPGSQRLILGKLCEEFSQLEG